MWFRSLTRSRKCCVADINWIVSLAVESFQPASNMIIIFVTMYTRNLKTKSKCIDPRLNFIVSFCLRPELNLDSKTLIKSMYCYTRLYPKLLAKQMPRFSGSYF